MQLHLRHLLETLTITMHQQEAENQGILITRCDVSRNSYAVDRQASITTNSPKESSATYCDDEKHTNRFPFPFFWVVSLSAF